MLLSDAAIIVHVLGGHYLRKNEGKDYSVTVKECTSYEIELVASDQAQAERIAKIIFANPEFRKFFVQKGTEVRVAKNKRERIQDEFSRWR